MRTNKTKERLKAGERVFGCFVNCPDATLVEMLGYQGWDFIVFDGEHGTLEPRDCENMVRAAELSGVTPIVRVTTNSPPIILRFMDTGAHGLHVPWVNSAAEAEAAVRSVKFHPRGTRGLANVRAADYAQRIPISEFVKQSNSETLVVIHIETVAAIEQLPEIAAVDGVDVLFIGPTDLSHSLAVPGQLQHPVMQKAMRRIVEMTAHSDAALGIFVANAAEAQQWCERGARYIATGLQSLLRQASHDYLQAIHDRNS